LSSACSSSFPPLLDQAAHAVSPTHRGVHNAAAAGHSGDRHRFRLHPHVRVELAAAILASDRATDLLLVIGYATLALPYMYAPSTPAEDDRRETLTEAAQILGRLTTIITASSCPTADRGSLRAFLTFAIVIGEFTMASLLNAGIRPYLQNIAPTVPTSRLRSPSSPSHHLGCMSSSSSLALRAESAHAR